MAVRIQPKDFQKLSNLGRPVNPNKVWIIKGDLTIKKASFLEKLFWGFAQNHLWFQKIFYGIDVKKSKKSLADLKAKIIQAEKKAGHESQSLHHLFNSSIDNFKSVNKIQNSALDSLKFPSQKKQTNPVTHSQTQQVNTNPVNGVNTSQTTSVNINPQVAATAKKVHFTVGTYNILFPQRDYPNKLDKNNRPLDHTHPHSTDMGYHRNADGEIKENSAYRLKVISQNIRNADLDVNCLQEVSKESFESLQWTLGDKYVGVWAPHKGVMPKPGTTLQQNLNGSIFTPDKHAHGVAIFYRKDQFDLVKSYGTKRFEQTGITKRHLMLDLRDKKSGLVTRYVTCHLTDPRNWEKKDKTKHIDAVLKDAHQNYKVDMIVVTGDMNQDQFGDLENGMPRKPVDLLSATAFEPLVKKHKYKHGAKGMNPNDFPSTEVERAGDSPEEKDYSPTGKLVETGRMIDHIFMKTINSNINPTIKLIGKGVPENFDLTGSDHKMVASVISV